jgi:hypothetical protein
MQKIVTVLPEDTFGISKVLPDYVVETTLHRVGQSSTKIEISHYYSTPTLKAKLLNLIARRKLPATLKTPRPCVDVANFRGGNSSLDYFLNFPFPNTLGYP